jgi:hypothetical protein
MQHAFGESEDKTVVLLNFHNTQSMYEKEEIDLDMPIKKIIYLDIGNIETIDYMSLTRQREDGLKNSIKLTISGDIKACQTLKQGTLYKNIISSGIKINFKQTTRDFSEAEAEVGKTNKDPSIRFAEILLDSIGLYNNNPYMLKVYEQIVNNRIV